MTAPEQEQETNEGLDLEAWRATRYTEKVLPSGLKVKLRRANLLTILSNGGEIPEVLVGYVVAAMTGQAVKVTADDMATLLAAYNSVTLASMVEPPIAAEPGPDVVGIAELSFEDKKAIFEWANAEVMALRSFRGETAESD